ncbi:MAG: hypothetical protein WD342_14320 [Verrucomicrobiales bacterium]
MIDRRETSRPGTTRRAVAPVLAVASLLLPLAPREGGAERQAPTAGEERPDRKGLSDRREQIRGDSGKWNDHAHFQHAPAPPGEPPGSSMDDWADQAPDQDFRADAEDDNWLVFRTRQLDDRDRAWVETIERTGDRFVVTMHQAVWQGNYRKNFTYYQLLAVNLGKLPPGRYEAVWIVKPLQFRQFLDPENRRESWPADEQAAEDHESEERELSFVVE